MALDFDNQCLFRRPVSKFPLHAIGSAQFKFAKERLMLCDNLVQRQCQPFSGVLI
jgi:hypothetical protein